MHYNLAFIGFGRVGKALARLLLAHTEGLASIHGTTWRLTGVATQRLGWHASPEGFDTRALLDLPGTLAETPAVDGIAAWLDAAKANIIFEMSPLNAENGQPAISYIEEAFEHGAHAVSANKGPVVHGYRHLTDLATSHGKAFRFESAVMDGAPIFSLFRECMPLARVSSFEGILNSTTNLILAEIEAGSDFEAAVKKAQAIGAAETDPAADIDGIDAAVKVAALVAVLMDVSIGVEGVARQGIRHLHPEDVRAARAAGTPYKLMCRAARHGKGIAASVKPERLPLDSPYALVGGTSSVVHFTSDVLPGLTITEHAPTPVTTAFGMLADFISLVKRDQEYA